MATVSDVMIKKFLKVSADDSLSSVIGKLRQKDERTAVVFAKEKYKGIFDRNSLLTTKLDPVKSKIKEFIKHPPVVSPDTTLVEAAELMYNAYPCVLIVKKYKKIIGIVRSRDFIHKIKDIPELRKLKVSEIMTKDLIAFNYKARLGDVLSIMKEKGIGRIPIIDNGGRVISMLTFTDIIEQILLRPKEKMRGHEKATLDSKGSKAWVADKQFLLDTNAGDEASRTVISVEPKTSLPDAIEKMYKYKISDILITENKKPVGIITTRDLLETFMQLKEPEYWPIQYFGLKNLKPFQSRMLKEIVQENYDKIKRVYFKDVIYMMVHVKPYEEGLAGKAKRKGKTKWSVRLRLAIPSRVFTTEEAHFNLGTAVSWAAKELEMLLQKYRVKYRERWQKHKKGRRAMFERFIRKKKDEIGGQKPYQPLVKRK